jgi:hypothetical protein
LNVAGSRASFYFNSQRAAFESENLTKTSLISCIRFIWNEYDKSSIYAGTGATSNTPGLHQNYTQKYFKDLLHFRIKAQF